MKLCIIGNGFDLHFNLRRYTESDNVKNHFKHDSYIILLITGFYQDIIKENANTNCIGIYNFKEEF